MKTSSNIALPLARPEYRSDDEQIMRRTVEYGFSDLWQDISDGQEMKNKTSSLSARRFQFLLMGAVSG